MPATPSTVVRRIRGVVAWFLTVLVAVLLPLTVTSTWLLSTLTHTNAYVSTMAPLIDDPVVRQTVATAATDELFRRVDVQGTLAAHLPGGSKILAGILAAQLRTTVTGLVQSTLRTDLARRIWNEENRRTHHLAMEVLAANPSSTQSVVLSIEALIREVVAALDARGITVFDSVAHAAEDVAGRGVVVMDAHQLRTARTVFHLAVTLRDVLPWLTLGLCVLLFLVTPTRRRTVVRASVATTVGFATVAGVLLVAHEQFDHAVGPSRRAFADAVWRIVLSGLTDWLRLAALAVVVGGVVAWGTGPSQAAASLRRGFRRGARRAEEGADRALEVAVAHGLADGVRRRHARVTAVVVSIGAGAVLVASSTTVLVVAVVATVATLALVHGLVRAASRTS